MKTLLIYPPFLASAGSEGYVSAGAPLGISMLAASLQAGGLEVELLDAFIEGFDDPGSSQEGEYSRVSRGICRKNRFKEGYNTFGLSFAEIVERVKISKPDIVGISIIFSSTYPAGLHIARLIKESCRDVTIVIGGNHATAVPREVLENSFVDYLVMGEGERAFTELVRELSDAGSAVADIAGVAFIGERGELVQNRPRLIEELDSLPYPAFDLLDMEKHFNVSAEGRTIKMMTSRGCTFDCCFCTVPGNTHRRFRARSPEDVLGEIELYVEKYAIEGIMFEDDNMTLNPERAKKIFRMIAERGYGLKLYARNFRADLFDAEMLGLMKRAGFETVWITPESGNQRVLEELIGKNFKLSEVDRAVDIIREADLEVGAAFVIGIPGESMGDIGDTARYARKLKRRGVRDFWISIATPIVGTRLYEDSLREGLISGMDLEKFSYQEAGLTTDGFLAEDVASLRRELMDELNSNA